MRPATGRPKLPPPRVSGEPLHLRRNVDPRPGLLWALLWAVPARHRRRALLLLVAVVAAALLADTTMPLVVRVAQRQSGWPLQQVGSDGTAVRSVQYLLRARGYDLAVDGVFGRRTRARVVEFQRARGLRVDGIVGPQTWSMLVVPGLRRGLEGYSVRAVQSQLSARGIPTAVDGVFGPVTERNVMRFQRARDLEASGIVGPVTWNALMIPRSRWQGPPATRPTQPTAPPSTPPPTLPETR